MKINKGKAGMVKKYALGGIIGGAAQAALGVGQTIYGFQQAKKANQQMQDVLGAAPKLALPSAYQEYTQKSMDRAALNAQTEAINRRLASSTQALSQAGGRALLGGLQGQVTAANMSEIQAQDAQLQREMQGLQVLGGAQANLQQQKEARFQMQYGAAAEAQNAALANIGGGLGSIAEGGMIAGTSFDKRGASSATRNSINSMPTFNSGGKLSGEFSHKSNPITMTDKNGNVVGEATGGEYILNTEQMKKASKESKYVRSLLKKKQFKG